MAYRYKPAKPIETKTFDGDVRVETDKLGWSRIIEGTRKGEWGHYTDVVLSRSKRYLYTSNELFAITRVNETRS